MADALASRPRAASPRGLLTWAALAVVLVAPVVVAATSPLLEWRGPVYVAAGLAGVIGLALLPLQPLLARDRLPGVSAVRGRRLHRWIGVVLLAAVAAHVVGLWITSPPDVVDALLLRSPTSFSPWGVLAMWALVVAALAAAARRRPRFRGRAWRLAHVASASAVVVATVLHALLIEGTMGTVSKAVLCVLALGATAWGWRGPARRSER